MSTTLTNGLKLPDKGSVDWYADMQNNYQILDGAVGTVAEHTTQIAGKAPAVHTHTKSDVTDLFNSANTWTGDNSFTTGLTINNAASLNAVLQNAVKGNVSTTGDFAIFIKDKVNGNAATSLLAVYRGGQDSGGSYAQINIDTKGNDNNRYNNSILFRINPADNSNNAILIPQRDKTIDLGTSSYQWNNLYAKNYYYNGTAWGLDKANEWTADQTIASNRFLRVYGYRFQVKNAGMALGTVPSSNQWTGMQFVDKNNTAISEIVQSFQSNGNSLYQINVYSNEANSEKRSVIAYTYSSANNVNALAFSSNLLPTDNNAYNLGVSTQKWKTLNGVNPGALSLPDMDSTVSKTTELAAAIDKTQAANSWTADFTGILSITWYVKGLTGPFRCAVFNNADIRYATWGQTFSANDVWYFIISFPVQNGKTYYFDNSFTRTSEDTAPILYGASAVYCLGNV